MSTKLFELNRWDPFVGCEKLSAGCDNCDGKDTCGIPYQGKPQKTSDFDKIVLKDFRGDYIYYPKPGRLDNYVYVCLSSDFYHEDIDPYRKKLYEFMYRRQDITFVIITKRVGRINHKEVYDFCRDNVILGVTIENNETLPRLEVARRFPFKEKWLVFAPLLEKIDTSKIPSKIRPYYLKNMYSRLVVEGEMGPKARLCKEDWVLSLKEFAQENNLDYWCKSLGSNFQR